MFLYLLQRFYQLYQSGFGWIFPKKAEVKCLVQWLMILENFFLKKTERKQGVNSGEFTYRCLFNSLITNSIPFSETNNSA